MRSSIPRLRSVRFKDGRAPIRRVYWAPDPAADRKAVRAQVESVIERHGDLRIVGMAFVVWGAEMSVTGISANSGDSNISSLAVPDLVRNFLLAQNIKRMALDALYPEDDGESS